MFDSSGSSTSGSILLLALVVCESRRGGGGPVLGAFEKKVSSLACVTRFEAGSDIARSGRQSTIVLGFRDGLCARGLPFSWFELIFASPPILGENSGSAGTEALIEHDKGFPYVRI